MSALTPVAWKDPSHPRGGQGTDALLATFLLNGGLRSAIESENNRQIGKWGSQTHSPAEWGAILMEEVGELAHELNRAEYEGEAGITLNLRDEAIQVAVLALKIAEMGR